jgi:hypothetical protein
MASLWSKAREVGARAMEATREASSKAVSATVLAVENVVEATRRECESESCFRSNLWKAEKERVHLHCGGR